MHSIWHLILQAWSSVQQAGISLQNVDKEVGVHAVCIVAGGVPGGGSHAAIHFINSLAAWREESTAERDQQLLHVACRGRCMNESCIYFPQSEVFQVAKISLPFPAPIPARSHLSDTAKCPTPLSIRIIRDCYSFRGNRDISNLLFFCTIRSMT